MTGVPRPHFLRSPIRHIQPTAAFGDHTYFADVELNGESLTGPLADAPAQTRNASDNCRVYGALNQVNRQRGLALRRAQRKRSGADAPASGIYLVKIGDAVDVASVWDPCCLSILACQVVPPVTDEAE